MASTYLSKSLSGSSGNQYTWTFSGWFKKAKNGSELRLLSSSDNASYDDNIRFNSDDTITIRFDNSIVLITNRKFRDTSGYYHIVVKADTNQTSANDRIVLYINGVDERTVGGYSTNSMPGQGVSGYTNYNAFYIGVTNPSANSNHFNGIMSHVHFTDGYAYTPSNFGETDTDTGQWKIKDNISVSYGTNGFWILKDGNSVTDQSGNSNNFTVASGTLTNTEDNPSNVFATWNPLAQTFSSIGYEHGNTTIATSADVGQRQSISTLAASSGKFYMECKLQAIGSNVGGSFPYAGIVAQSKYAGNTYVGGNGCGWTTGGDVYNGGGSATSSGVSYTTGDIIGLAVDITNSKMYWHKNGTYIFSGNPSAGTGGFDISARTSEDAIGFATSLYNSNGTWQCNFGNGYFGTTVVSSAGTNASGNGIFEYDCPTGFTSLSTKGLNL